MSYYIYLESRKRCCYFGELPKFCRGKSVEDSFEPLPFVYTFAMIEGV